MTEDEFQASLAGHAEWMDRFRDALAGRGKCDFSPELIRNHAACAVGHWLITHDSPALRNPLRRQTFNALHQTFHEIAAEIATMIRDGFAAGAVEPYLEALESLARELAALQELNHRHMIELSAA